MVDTAYRARTVPFTEELKRHRGDGSTVIRSLHPRPVYRSVGCNQQQVATSQWPDGQGLFITKSSKLYFQIKFCLSIGRTAFIIAMSSKIAAHKSIEPIEKDVMTRHGISRDTLGHSKPMHRMRECRQDIAMSLKSELRSSSPTTESRKFIMPRLNVHHICLDFYFQKRSEFLRDTNASTATKNVIYWLANKQ